MIDFLRFHDDLAPRVVAEILRRVEPVDESNAAHLIEELNRVTLTGEMADFRDAGARAGYIQKRFASRSSSVAASLLHPDVQPICMTLLGETQESSLALSVQTTTMKRGLLSEHPDAASSKTIRMASVGGAAGEAVFAVMVLRDYIVASRGGPMDCASGGMRIDAIVLDYEAGWQKAAESLLPAWAGARGDGDAVTFGQCDVLHGIDEPVNAAVRTRAGMLDLLVFSYVLVENAKGLRESLQYDTGQRAWGGLLPGLLLAAPVGAVFLMLDSSFKLWERTGNGAGERGLIQEIVHACGVQVEECRPRWRKEVLRHPRLSNLCNNLLVLVKKGSVQ